MKTFGDEEICIHVIFISALFGGEWSASHLCRINLKGKSPVPFEQEDG
jgi:hypothetical protein